jgi:hypothetical protein
LGSKKTKAARINLGHETGPSNSLARSFCRTRHQQPSEVKTRLLAVEYGQLLDEHEQQSGDHDGLLICYR